MNALTWLYTLIMWLSWSLCRHWKPHKIFFTCILLCVCSVRFPVFAFSLLFVQWASAWNKDWLIDWSTDYIIRTQKSQTLWRPPRLVGLWSPRMDHIPATTCLIVSQTHPRFFVFQTSQLIPGCSPHKNGSDIAAMTHAHSFV